MKYLFRAMMVVGVWTLLGGVGSAQEAGKVLLLRNGRVLEGQIEQAGKQICIRNGSSEITISADRALKVCANWDEAFYHVRGLLKANDADDLVKLARWCQRNGRSEQALTQAQQALALKPGHADAKQIVAMLERAKLEASKATLPAKTPNEPARVVEAAPVVDVTTETLAGFITKVQPILMNTCATCHATGRGGAFHLERVANVSQKIATEQNLARVLSYVDYERPAISPFLLKAVLKHGTATQAPIKDRSARAFQTLQDWITLTLARNPHLKDLRAAGKAATPPVSTTPVEAAKTLQVEAKNTVPDVNPTPRVLPATVVQTPIVPVNDPHDPNIFNKAYHPQR